MKKIHVLSAFVLLFMGLTFASCIHPPENEKVDSVKPGDKGDYLIRVIIPLPDMKDTVYTDFTWTHDLSVSTGEAFEFGVDLKNPERGWRYLKLPEDTLGKGKTLKIYKGKVLSVERYQRPMRF